MVAAGTWIQVLTERLWISVIYSYLCLPTSLCLCCVPENTWGQRPVCSTMKTAYFGKEGNYSEATKNKSGASSLHTVLMFYSTKRKSLLKWKRYFSNVSTKETHCRGGGLIKQGSQMKSVFFLGAFYTRKSVLISACPRSDSAHQLQPLPPTSATTDFSPVCEEWVWWRSLRWRNVLSWPVRFKIGQDHIGLRCDGAKNLNPSSAAVQGIAKSAAVLVK